MSFETENLGTTNTAGAVAGSQATVPMDMDNSVVVAGEVHGQPSGGAGKEIATEAGQEDDGKVKAPETVKEGEKKDARKQMASRSDVWNHFKKIKIEGVLRKGKCNYCNTDIAAHSVINDVSTRWNSTYFMLKAAVSYEKVFARYTDEDPYFALDLLSEKGKEFCIGVPDETDWENARQMADFLGHFADLTTRVCASLHVTANNFFHEIGEVNLLVKSWMESDDVLQKAKAQRMKDKFDKYWGNWHEPDPSKKGKEKEKENINLLIFISATLDPRYKLSEYTQFAVLEMYGHEKGPKVWAAINNCLRDLFQEYRVMYAPHIASVQASFSPEAEVNGGRASMMKSLIAKKMRLNNGGSSNNRSELDKFLAEEPEDDGLKFDILSWWKVNSSRFPILACLAHDVFAIPISTVASESAFSTGGRVLDDFRTSLTPFMVEALVCTQDWLRHTTPIDIAENTAELTKLEQEYKDIKAKAAKLSTTAKATS